MYYPIRLRQPYERVTPLEIRVSEHTPRRKAAAKTGQVAYSLVYGAANELGNAGMSPSTFVISRAANLFLSERFANPYDVYRDNIVYPIARCTPEERPEKIVSFGGAGWLVRRGVADTVAVTTFWIPMYYVFHKVIGTPSNEAERAVAGLFFSAWFIGPTMNATVDATHWLFNRIAERRRAAS